MPLRTIYINLKGRLIEKITGAVPTENNYTDAEKLKLANMTGGTLTQEQLDYIISQVPSTDISGKVDKVTGSDLLATTEAAKIHSAGSDNQDLTNYVVKESGKSLVSDTEISKIHSNTLDHSNSLDHSNNLDHSHINASTLNSIQEALTTTLKTSYDNAVTHAGSSHAPSDAQKNSDITKAEIEAKLTGELTSHSHASSGGLTQQQILRLI